MDLALNKQQKLICHKTKTTNNQQPTNVHTIIDSINIDVI